MISVPGWLRPSPTCGYRPPTGLKPWGRPGGSVQRPSQRNDQWRVCFVWTDRGAMEIEVTDYH